MPSQTWNVPLAAGVCSIAGWSGIPCSWEVVSLGPPRVLSGSSAFDVLTRSARIESGPLGHLRIRPETPVQQSAVLLEKLRRRELSCTQFVQQRFFFVRRRQRSLSRVTTGKQDTPQRLLELAHVPRPGIAAGQPVLQGFQNICDELGRLCAGDARDEQPHQLLELGRRFRDALPQRRNLDHVGTQPVEEVVAEAPVASQGCERPVRRRDDAPRETFLLVSAEGGEGALLEHLQQLDLHRYRRFADLVQEQRAVRTAALEYALVVLDRAGEGALTVAEELRLDQR